MSEFFKQQENNAFTQRKSKRSSDSGPNKAAQLRQLKENMKGNPLQLFAQEEEEVQAKSDSIQLSEEEELQKKAINERLKRNDDLQLKAGSIQLLEEEEKLQMKNESVQLQEEEELQMKAGSGGEGTSTNMPEDVKSKMENSFGTDFSNVNIHKDSDQATNIGALAYTQGSDVHFAPGQYEPGSTKGQELLGHELTHVVQQREGRVKPDTEQQKGLNINSDTSLEKEADEAGAKAAQGKMANVKGSGNGVQKKEKDDQQNKYESYKSKSYKLKRDSQVSIIAKNKGEFSVNKKFDEELKFEINKGEIIPNGLFVKINDVDFSYEKSGKDFTKKEVANITVLDKTNKEWNGKTTWTTRSNISTTPINQGLYKVIEQNANTRKKGVKVGGKQKTIPISTEIDLTDYKEISNQVYFKAIDHNTKIDYGWINAKDLGSDIYNNTLGIDKAEYISKKEGHSVINTNNTSTFKQSGVHFPEVKDNGKPMLIEKGTKVVTCNEEKGYALINYLDVPGHPIGWTNKKNLKYLKDKDYSEVKNNDARLRSKSKKFIKNKKKLKAGQFVIEKEKANTFHPKFEHIKVGLVEKENGEYKEKANSDFWVKPNSLTANWANIKSDNATWEKINNKAVYTGQIDYLQIMGSRTLWDNKKKIYEPDVDKISLNMKVQYDKLRASAKQDGFDILLISGFRTYPEQEALYAVRHKRGVSTAPPGKSKHQNGTAIDINTDGFNTKLYYWMKKNAAKYGFIRTVSSEHWHWEYKPEDSKKYGYKMPYITQG